MTYVSSFLSMTAPSTCCYGPPGAGGLLVAGTLAAQTRQSARPASPPAAALASPGCSCHWPLGLAAHHRLCPGAQPRGAHQPAYGPSNTQVLRQSKAALLPTANINGSQAWQLWHQREPADVPVSSQTVAPTTFRAIAAGAVSGLCSCATPSGGMRSIAS